MYRAGGSSNTPSHSSGSYSSEPAAPRLRQEDIDAISSQVMISIMPQITASIMPQLTDTITKQISRAFRVAQGGSSSDHASMPDPQDEDEDGEDQRPVLATKKLVSDTNGISDQRLMYQRPTPYVSATGALCISDQTNWSLILRVSATVFGYQRL